MSESDRIEVEGRLSALETKVDLMQGTVDGIDKKLDTLVVKTAMGRGALKFCMYAGGAIAALGAGGAWVWDHVPH